MKLPPGVKYFVLAGVVGLVATVMIHKYITAKTAIPIRPQGPVVVSTVDIAPGAAIDDGMVEAASYPRENIPSKAVGDKKQVVGRVVQVFIAKGEPVLTTKLAQEGAAAGLRGLLDPNKLAVTIRVDDVTGVAGFINPGDRVDLLVEAAAPETKEHISKIILQNLKVLSKGQIWEQTPTGEKKPQVVNTVTLEVTAEEAEVINLATNQGRIRLALRNQLNQAQFMTRGVGTSQLLRGGAGPSPTPAAQGATKQDYSVEIIKGLKRSTAEL